VSPQAKFGKPRLHRLPGGRDRVFEQVHLGAHLGAEQPGGSGDKAGDQKHRDRQGCAEREPSEAPDRLGERVEDHGEQDRAEDQQKQVLQTVGDRRKHDEAENDQQALGEAPDLVLIFNQALVPDSATGSAALAIQKAGGLRRPLCGDASPISLSSWRRSSRDEEMRKIARPTKNRILAIPAAAPAIPDKSRRPFVQFK
jgi:hypothetical protein